MAGQHAGTTGPISMVNPGMLLDVILSPGGSVRVDVPQGWSSFAYVYDGE
jgi:redox-sensitive bicupin YhaK (pirin superfamily)